MTAIKIKFTIDRVNADGDELLSFWIKSQGFTLERGFEKTDEGKKLIEWYKKQIKNALDVYAEAYHKEKIREVVESISEDVIKLKFPVSPSSKNYAKRGGARWLKSELLSKIESNG